MLRNLHQVLLNATTTTTAKQIKNKFSRFNNITTTDNIITEIQLLH